MRSVADSGRTPEEAARRVAYADDGVARVEADDGARRRIEFKDAARVEGQVVVAGAARLAEAVAATVEARGHFADEHHARPQFGEESDALRARAGPDAGERLRLLTELAVAEVRFGEEAELGVQREVLVEVVAEAAAEAVDRLAEALKVDARVEHADLGPVTVNVRRLRV